MLSVRQGDATPGSGLFSDVATTYLFFKVLLFYYGTESNIFNVDGGIKQVYYDYRYCVILGGRGPHLTNLRIVSIIKVTVVQMNLQLRIPV